MSFFRYALLDLIRGRRRTFSAILGIVLAVTFLSGTFIAIDSSARAALEGILSQDRGDFTVRATAGNPEALAETLHTYPGVVDATVFGHFVLQEVFSEEGQYLMGVPLLFVDPTDLPSSLQDREVAGSLELPRGSLALSEPLARSLEVGLGARITLRAWNPEAVQEPFGLETIFTVTGIFSPPPRIGFLPVSGEWVSLVRIQDWRWFAEQLGFSVRGGNLHAEVWIDRARFINPYDIPGSHGTLARFERELQEAVRPYGGSVQNNLANALNLYESQAAQQRLIYLFLALPVLLLGLYLGAVGVDLGHAERRRELAVLKARGAGGGQVLGVLLLGAVLGGLLATLVGLVAGIVFSRLLLTVVNPFALDVAASYWDVVLSANTVITVAIFAVVFMLFASYRSAKRTARLPVAQTLRHYAPGETRIEYKPTVDIVLVSLGFLSLAGVWYVSRYPGTFITFFVGIIFIVLLPLAPIFLIVGGTRLLTRSTGRIYAGAARLWKPLAGGLYHIIHRNLGRNPRRASNVAVIIALGLAFGMFIFAFLGSTVGYQQRIIRADIGADMSIENAPPGDATFVANVSALTGVAGVTTVRPFTLQAFFRNVNAFAVDPDRHFAVTQPEYWYFDGLSAGAAASLLREPGQVLVSRRLANDLFLEVGDRVSLTGQSYTLNETSGKRDTMFANVTVAGVIRALPGTLFGRFSGVGPSGLYGSFETLEPFLTLLGISLPFEGEIDRLLVDLQPAARWEDAKAAVESLGARDVRVTEEELQRTQANPFFSSILGFISLEIAFIAGILTAGLGLILFAATLERDVEFAAIRARGASGWQAAGILTGEAFSIMLVGLIIGVGIGLLVAFYVLQLFVIPFAGQNALVPYLFEVPVEGFLLVGLAAGAMLFTALLIAARLARMNLAKVLKVRGG